jgi:ubiquinone/menaquinone biosynthesis C-methylase UbiE
METDWKQESQRFDSVAELYDTYRPGYPEGLIKSLITHSNLRPGDRILEVGSGTGKATEQLAGRGYSITCLEPGRNLAAIAARKFIHQPEIRFEHARFEDWESPAGGFDLLLSAQAFHWVPQEVRFIKAAQVLRPGGHLALIWNMYPYIDSPLRRDLDRVYRQCAPEISKDIVDIEPIIQQTSQEIRDSGFFDPPCIERFPWSRRMTVESHLGLLNTFSDHLRLYKENRKSLFDGIAETILHHGGEIEHHYLAVLHIARKRDK